MIAPNCEHCGKQLRRYRWAPEGTTQWGRDGHGFFCTLRCGYLYGLARARHLNGGPR